MGIGGKGQAVVAIAGAIGAAYGQYISNLGKQKQKAAMFNLEQGGFKSADETARLRAESGSGFLEDKRGEGGSYGALAGAGAGAVTGAIIGSFIPIIGTAIGGVIGGIAGAIGGYFAGSGIGEALADTGKHLREFDAKVRSLQLGASLGDLQKSLKLFSEGRASQQEVSGVVSSSINQLTKGFATIDSDQQLVDFQGAISKTIPGLSEYINKVAASSDSFEELENIVGVDTLHSFAQLSGVSLERMRKEIEDGVIVRKKATAAQKAQLAAIQATNKVLRQARSAISAFAAIEQTLKQFDSALDNTSQSINNAFGPASIAKISPKFADISNIFDFDSFNQQVDSLGTVMGAAGGGLANDIKQFAQLSNILPNVLTEAAAEIGIGGVRASEIIEKKLIAADPGGIIGAEFRRAIVRRITAMADMGEGGEGKFAGRIKEDIDGVIRDLTKGMSETQKAFQRAAEFIDAANARLAKAYDLRTKLELNAAKQLASIMATQYENSERLRKIRGKEPDIVGGQISFAAQQNALLGGTQVEGMGSNVKLVGVEFVRLKQKIAESNQELSSFGINVGDIGADLTDSQRLLIDENAKLKEEFARTQAVLKNYANIQNRIGVLQQKIAQEQSKRNQMLAGASSLAFATDERRSEMAREMFAAQVAARKGINAIPSDMRAGVLNMLNQFSEVALFNGKTGKEVKREIDISFLEKFFGPLTDAQKKLITEATTAEERFINDLKKVQDQAVDAQKALLAGMGDDRKNLAKTIGNLHRELVSGIKDIFLQQQERGIEGQISENKATKTSAEGQLKVLQEIRDLGIPVEDPRVFDAIKANIDTIKTLNKAREKQENFGKIRGNLDLIDKDLFGAVSGQSGALQDAQRQKNERNVANLRGTFQQKFGVDVGNELVAVLRDRLRAILTDAASKGKPLTGAEIAEALKKTMGEFGIASTEKQKDIVSSTEDALRRAGLGPQIDLLSTNIDAISTAFKKLPEGTTWAGLTEKIDESTLALERLRGEIDKIKVDQGVNQAAGDAAAAQGGGGGGPVGNEAAGGLIPLRFAGGGFSPHGTDTVPAMLTPGEFVVNKAATKRNAGALQAINSGKTQYLEGGGEVKDWFGTSRNVKGDKRFTHVEPENKTVKALVDYVNKIIKSVQANPQDYDKLSFGKGDLGAENLGKSWGPTIKIKVPGLKFEDKGITRWKPSGELAKIIPLANKSVKDEREFERGHPHLAGILDASTGYKAYVNKDFNNIQSNDGKNTHPGMGETKLEDHFKMYEEKEAFFHAPYGRHAKAIYFWRKYKEHAEKTKDKNYVTGGMNGPPWDEAADDLTKPWHVNISEKNRGDIRRGGDPINLLDETDGNMWDIRQSKSWFDVDGMKTITEESAQGFGSYVPYVKPKAGLFRDEIQAATASNQIEKLGVAWDKQPRDVASTYREWFRDKLKARKPRIQEFMGADGLDQLLNLDSTTRGLDPEEWRGGYASKDAAWVRSGWHNVNKFSISTRFKNANVGAGQLDALTINPGDSKSWGEKLVFKDEHYEKLHTDKSAAFDLLKKQFSTIENPPLGGAAIDFPDGVDTVSEKIQYREAHKIDQLQDMLGLNKDGIKFFNQVKGKKDKKAAEKQVEEEDLKADVIAARAATLSPFKTTKDLIAGLTGSSKLLKKRGDFAKVPKYAGLDRKIRDLWMVDWDTNTIDAILPFISELANDLQILVSTGLVRGIGQDGVAYNGGRLGEYISKNLTQRLENKNDPFNINNQPEDNELLAFDPDLAALAGQEGDFLPVKFRDRKSVAQKLEMWSKDPYANWYKGVGEEEEEVMEAMFGHGVAKRHLGVMQKQSKSAYDTAVKNHELNPVKLAAGGKAFAPYGTDTVPAMLTPGEFVVNKKSAKANMPLLKAINSGTQYLAEGDIVRPPKISEKLRKQMEEAVGQIDKQQKSREELTGQRPVPFATSLGDKIQGVFDNIGYQFSPLSRPLVGKSGITSPLAKEDDPDYKDFMPFYASPNQPAPRPTDRPMTPDEMYAEARGSGPNTYDAIDRGDTVFGIGLGMLQDAFTPIINLGTMATRAAMPGQWLRDDLPSLEERLGRQNSIKSLFDAKIRQKELVDQQLAEQYGEFGPQQFSAKGVLSDTDYLIASNLDLIATGGAAAANKGGLTNRLANFLGILDDTGDIAFQAEKMSRQMRKNAKTSAMYAKWKAFEESGTMFSSVGVVDPLDVYKDLRNVIDVTPSYSNVRGGSLLDNFMQMSTSKKPSFIGDTGLPFADDAVIPSMITEPIDVIPPGYPIQRSTVQDVTRPTLQQSYSPATQITPLQVPRKPAPTNTLVQQVQPSLPAKGLPEIPTGENAIVDIIALQREQMERLGKYTDDLANANPGSQAYKDAENGIDLARDTFAYLANRRNEIKQIKLLRKTAPATEVTERGLITTPSLTTSPTETVVGEIVSDAASRAGTLTKTEELALAQYRAERGLATTGPFAGVPQEMANTLGAMEAGDMIAARQQGAWRTAYHTKYGHWPKMGGTDPRVGETSPFLPGGPNVSIEPGQPLTDVQKAIPGFEEAYKRAGLDRQIITQPPQVKIPEPTSPAPPPPPPKKTGPGPEIVVENPEVIARKQKFEQDVIDNLGPEGETYTKFLERTRQPRLDSPEVKAITKKADPKRVITSQPDFQSTVNQQLGDKFGLKPSDLLDSRGQSLETRFGSPQPFPTDPLKASYLGKKNRLDIYKGMDVTEADISHELAHVVDVAIARNRPPLLHDGKLATRASQDPTSPVGELVKTLFREEQATGKIGGYSLDDIEALLGRQLTVDDIAWRQPTDDIGEAANTLKGVDGSVLVFGYGRTNKYPIAQSRLNDLNYKMLPQEILARGVELGGETGDDVALALGNILRNSKDQSLYAKLSKSAQREMFPSGVNLDPQVQAVINRSPKIPELLTGNQAQFDEAVNTFIEGEINLRTRIGQLPEAPLSPGAAALGAPPPITVRYSTPNLSTAGETPLVLESGTFPPGSVQSQLENLGFPQPFVRPVTQAEEVEALLNQPLVSRVGSGPPTIHVEGLPVRTPPVITDGTAINPFPPTAKDVKIGSLVAGRGSTLEKPKSLRQAIWNEVDPKLIEEVQQARIQASLKNKHPDFKESTPAELKRERGEIKTALVQARTAEYVKNKISSYLQRLGIKGKPKPIVDPPKVADFEFLQQADEIPNEAPLRLEGDALPVIKPFDADRHREIKATFKTNATREWKAYKAGGSNSPLNETKELHALRRDNKQFFLDEYREKPTGTIFNTDGEFYKFMELYGATPESIAKFASGGEVLDFPTHDKWLEHFTNSIKEKPLAYKIREAQKLKKKNRGLTLFEKFVQDIKSSVTDPDTGQLRSSTPTKIQKLLKGLFPTSTVGASDKTIFDLPDSQFPPDPPPWGLASGGSVPRFSGGGKFPVKGTDTVPAMLTPGEFVMKKSAVDKHGIGFMQSINNGTQYLQEGGATGHWADARRQEPHGGSHLGLPYAVSAMPAGSLRNARRPASASATRPDRRRGDDEVMRQHGGGPRPIPDPNYIPPVKRQAFSGTAAAEDYQSWREGDQMLTSQRLGMNVKAVKDMQKNDKIDEYFQQERDDATKDAKEMELLGKKDTTTNRSEWLRSRGFAAGGLVPQYLQGGGLSADPRLQRGARNSPIASPTLSAEIAKMMGKKTPEEKWNDLLKSLESKAKIAKAQGRLEDLLKQTREKSRDEKWEELKQSPNFLSDRTDRSTIEDHRSRGLPGRLPASGFAEGGIVPKRPDNVPEESVWMPGEWGPELLHQDGTTRRNQGMWKSPLGTIYTPDGRRGGTEGRGEGDPSRPMRPLIMGGHDTGFITPSTNRLVDKMDARKQEPIPDVDRRAVTAAINQGYSSPDFFLDSNGVLQRSGDLFSGKDLENGQGPVVDPTWKSGDDYRLKYLSRGQPAPDEMPPWNPSEDELYWNTYKSIGVDKPTIPKGSGLLDREAPRRKEGPEGWSEGGIVPQYFRKGSKDRVRETPFLDRWRANIAQKKKEQEQRQKERQDTKPQNVKAAAEAARKKAAEEQAAREAMASQKAAKEAAAQAAAQKAAAERAAREAMAAQKAAAERVAREAEDVKVPDAIPTAPRDEIVPKESIPRIDIKEPVLVAPTVPTVPTTESTPLERGAEAAAQAAAQEAARKAAAEKAARNVENAKKITGKVISVLQSLDRWRGIDVMLSGSADEQEVQDLLASLTAKEIEAFTFDQKKVMDQRNYIKDLSTEAYSEFSGGPYTGNIRQDILTTKNNTLLGPIGKSSLSDVTKAEIDGMENDIREWMFDKEHHKNLDYPVRDHFLRLLAGTGDQTKLRERGLKEYHVDYDSEPTFAGIFLDKNGGSGIHDNSLTDVGDYIQKIGPLPGIENGWILPERIQSMLRLGVPTATPDGFNTIAADQFEKLSGSDREKFFPQKVQGGEIVRVKHREVDTKSLFGSADPMPGLIKQSRVWHDFLRSEDWLGSRTRIPVSGDTAEKWDPPTPNEMTHPSLIRPPSVRGPDEWDDIKNVAVPGKLFPPNKSDLAGWRKDKKDVMDRWMAIRVPAGFDGFKGRAAEKAGFLVHMDGRQKLNQRTIMKGSAESAVFSGGDAANPPPMTRLAYAQMLSSVYQMSPENRTFFFAAENEVQKATRAKKLGLNTDTTVHKATGGSIFSPKGTDTVPAMLTPGEFVIRKSAVDAVGVNALKNINSMGSGSRARSGSYFNGGGPVEAGASGAARGFLEGALKNATTAITKMISAFKESEESKAQGAPISHTLNSDAFTTAIGAFDKSIERLETLLSGGITMVHQFENMAINMNVEGNVAATTDSPELASTIRGAVTEGINNWIETSGLNDLPRAT
jgi:hypothetical protein